MLTSPFVRKPTSVQQVMFTVLVALLPAIALYVWQFGPGIVVNILIATVSAVGAEAAILKLRKKPVGLYVSDLSAVVTAWLIALTFPTILPAWILILATVLSIVAVKQLYGGLGQNPFNPAMAAYCLMIVAYPSAMSQWPAAGWMDLSTHLQLIGGASFDAVTGATPLDALRTGLRSGAAVDSILGNGAFGALGGRGWEWIGLGYLAGGLFLIQRRVITWHLPTAFLVGLIVVSGLFWMANPTHYASPMFHLASGGTLLAAFFIVTDPVSGATTPRGKLIFAASIALITYLIRNFGAYPDGIAFAVLLMNLCVPLIDMKTQPRVFGHKGE
ncbi:RnfABCDGE type electron transport complex subunit D [Denitromonas ohlonensis]|uniref:Ion-translocating oxidoreductase complex subunit D n=2 Tax=Denitromonas TaxID=139331 RepID=A0A557RVQ7_9RHOO|nr:RnfABCDGE type electron transport complex subunit D [Denitromonas ohlonensis]TVT50272.1 MAG: RnfABCDGE type electron transport complex subunit D [Denitromonas halophila]TVO69229.1 RnfABCDGE type electron transport complex subunit D [Denitromonas ohlonensis]TVO77329.1 RnfABCDGE type electron transport complex subunit D [Denitromonas ohlonensis]TVT74943.1 MAG: RnfABCDGE type electron transport complex subunit D [Denitromonas halophila]TVT78048.1 MAG: RnfABCDGE type electron transport complex 